MGQRLGTHLPDSYRVEEHPAKRFNRYRFVLYREDRLWGRGTHFTGAQFIRPWIEFQPTRVFSAESSADVALFKSFGGLVGAGGHIMVHYLQDSETAALLTRDVPPPVTPLGYLLWLGGVRWFKDWYFTEGWMEGDQKLQGNLPLNTDVKQQREQEWCAALDAFRDETDNPRCRARADLVLHTV